MNETLQELVTRLRYKIEADPSDQYFYLHRESIERLLDAVEVE